MSSSLSKPKVIVVCGPTATGKSDTAITIAQDIQQQYGISCEILSTDSRQIYRQLDIGTGKVTVQEMQGIPHHMIDIADPMEVISVVAYKKIADQILMQIIDRGNIPILCGGTGQYIDALIYDMQLSEVAPNPALRAELEQFTIDELIARFQIRNTRDGIPQPHQVDLSNKRRVIRAIEILEALGHIPSITTNERFDVLWIGLDCSDELLKKRINRRLATRMQSGMLQESIDLITTGAVTRDRMRTLGLEYAFMADIIEGYATEDESITRLQYAIWHYAKRQRTWFRKNKNIHWIDMSETAGTKVTEGTEDTKDTLNSKNAGHASPDHASHIHHPTLTQLLTDFLI